MHPLNPFLRAFFNSALQTQCNPIKNHVLLVPTTEILLTSKDRETNVAYADLTSSEDFVASHVLRISGSIKPGSGSLRDNRGKAKQFTTINGRTVMVKESLVYSSKGFKGLNQAQLLSDVFYYPSSLDSQQWLVYYISKPLVGSLEHIKISPAVIPDLVNGVRKLSDPQGSDSRPETPSSKHGKNEINSFNDLLNNFSMIARQMQSGLERVFKEFHIEINEGAILAQPKASSKSSQRTSRTSSLSSATGSIHSRFSNGHAKSPSTAKLNVNDDEDRTRRALETAVITAIDLFQHVDKQQLINLGANTQLTGPVVERLIERYVTEQLHDLTLFPMLCSSRKLEDLELESQIHHMEYIDISQVGITIGGGHQGKEALLKLVARAVEEFRKLGVAGSPQQMMEILLSTQKVLTSGESSIDTKGGSKSEGEAMTEKSANSMTINADTLVSLLIIVVIRSKMRHLQARLAYIRNFTFVEDVDSGEMGYALSTFEAVISYLASDAGGLRKASRQNSRLWHSIREGELPEIQAILDPEQTLDAIGTRVVHHQLDRTQLADDHEINTMPESPDFKERKESDKTDHVPEVLADDRASSNASSLAHVFPFQATTNGDASLTAARPVKRVSMDMRSVSNTSEYSFNSRATSRTSTLDSRLTGLEGDTSIGTLSQTQDLEGNSILMMAMESRQPAVLEYLLTLEHFFPIQTILQDSNNEGTSLLSAAIQLAHPKLIEIILHHVMQTRDKQVMLDYFAKEDIRGRTAAHYLFNAPYLIQRFGHSFPWRQKDKNGQTPLLALCRSYDHPHYSGMVRDALHHATMAQNDGERLHLDDHVDAKGNTLLHVVNEPQLAAYLLRHCDSDPNAANDKRLTPLMVASKYGRIDMVRVFFSDRRTDIYAKEHRGMTAAELAKDDEMRNRIDDLMLVSNIPAADGRVTAVVRSFFVEDGSIRLIIKSAVRNENGMIGITTCRRSLLDFENLAQWLALEQPASWLPSIFNFQSPFQIPSKPSRAALQDIQVRLDRFLNIMLAHSTFSTHELLWEFVLFPEIQPEMMAERSRKKVELRSEKIKEEYQPIDDVHEVENFVGHARETIRGVSHSTKSVMRRVVNVRNISLDMGNAFELCARSFSTLKFLPSSHTTALDRFSQCLHPHESEPYKFFHQDLQAISSTILAMLSSLSRPHALITSLQDIHKAIDRHTASLRRSDRWPLGLLDDTRKGIHTEAHDRVQRSREDLRTVACELRYTQQTVAAELAGWQDLHQRLGRRAIRALAERTVVREKSRLEGMKRAVRELGL